MLFRLILTSSVLALAACGRGGPVDTPTNTTGTGTGIAYGTATGTATGTGTGTGTATGTGTGTGGSYCDSPPGGPGPWADQLPGGGEDIHPIEAAGATITYDALTNDAGLAAVIAAATGNFDPVPVDLNITGAIVTARGYVPVTNDGTVTLWLEDKDGVVQTFRVDTMTAGGIDPIDILPGDAVSMHVTEVEEYFGTFQIAAIDSFSIDSSGNAVPVLDVMGGVAIDPSTQENKTVEVWGTLVTDPVDCGGRDCFELDYGAANTIEFRTGTGFQYKDDCIHWIGPLSEFQGAGSLDADDFDWYRWW